MRTEISCKFTRDSLEREYAAAGLELLGWYTDPRRPVRPVADGPAPTRLMPRAPVPERGPDTTPAEAYGALGLIERAPPTARTWSRTWSPPRTAARRWRAHDEAISSETDRELFHALRDRRSTP